MMGPSQPHTTVNVGLRAGRVDKKCHARTKYGQMTMIRQHNTTTITTTMKTMPTQHNPRHNHHDDACIFYQQQWEQTWTAFQAALRNPHQEFHAFRWVWRLLTVGLLQYALYGRTGLYRTNLHVYYKSFIPCLAIFLILCVVASYFLSLRSVVVRGSDGRMTPNLSSHDLAVIYLGTMILYNFIMACFKSPGVVMTKDDGVSDNEESPHVRKDQHWTCVNAQGGCCFLDPVFNMQRENKLTRQYFMMSSATEDGKSGKPTSNPNTVPKVFPSYEPTFCTTCQHMRPPRCHHCSQCHRCILRFDHHCIWLNNCVGYGNYRHFFLTVFYLNVGCWYGAFLLYQPFYGPLREQIQEVGWNNALLKNEHGTGLLDLPPLITLLQQLVTRSLTEDQLVKLIFPLLFLVGALQTVFLGYHSVYAMSALTTLEYNILLEREYEHVCGQLKSLQQQGGTVGTSKSGSFELPINPFSHGSRWKNLQQVLGQPLYWIFLPVSVEPEPLVPMKEELEKKSN